MVRILSMRSGIQGRVLTLHVLPMMMKLLYSHRSLTMRWTHIPKVGQLENLRMKEQERKRIDWWTPHMILSISRSVPLLSRAFDTLLRMCGSWCLIRRNSFQSWYSWEKSFSIDLVRRVKIIIPILKKCLVFYKRFIFVPWAGYCRKMRCPREGVLEATRYVSYFPPVRVLFRKKKEKNEDGRTNIGNFI